MAQKIADFFAQIGIKVDEKALNRFEKSVDNIGRALHNMEVSAKKTAGKVSNNLGQFAKAESKLTKEIEKGNKALQRRANIRNRLKGQSAGGDRLKGKGYVWGNLSHLDPIKNISNSARKSQQMMYDKLFGAIDTSGAEKEKAKIDRLHGMALREDARRTKAAENIARIQANAEKRIQEMAARTAAIREAGAKRAAAILQAAEIRANAMAARGSGGGAGGSGRRFNMMGGATVGGAIGSASSSMAGFLPGFGAAYSLVNLNRIGQELQSVENALLAVSESEQQAAERMQFLQSVGAEMGKTVRGLGPEFVKLTASIQGTALAGQEQGIFRSFMKYGTVMGLDEESMKGTFRAVSQMVSKQQVYAEELRGQLAERMPAAVRIAAEVMTGGDTKALNKMMEAGQLNPNELLPRMAEYMDKLSNTNQAYARALQTSIVAQGRMNFQWEQFVKIFAKGGGDAAFSKIFNTVAEFFKTNPKLAQGMANALGKVATGIEWTAEALTNVINAFDKLGDSMGVGGTNLALFSGMIVMLSTHFGRVASLAYGFFLIIEDIALGMQGLNSYTKDFIDFLNDNAWASVALKATAFALAVGLLASNLKRAAQWGGILAGAGAAGGGAKGKGGMLGGALATMRAHPYMTAAAVAGAGVYYAYDEYANTTDPKIISEKEQIDLRLRNLQRGPGNGFLTEMTNKYSLPGINQPSVTIDKLEINVPGTSNPEEVASKVLEEFKKAINPKNFPVNE